MIKQGAPDALALIGVHHRAEVVIRDFALTRRRVRVGETLCFKFTLVSTSPAAQKVVVDYVVQFVNASGGHGSKVFKLKTFELPGRGRVALAKAHSLRPITTRTYYPGRHRLQIQVNGAVKHETFWQLERAQG